MLKLNDSKTEFLVIDSKHVSRTDAEVTSLCVGDSNVAAVSAALTFVLF